MKKNLSLSLVLICISTILLSQQKTFKIDYNFYISEEIKNIDVEHEKDEAKKEIAMMALIAAMFQEDDKPVAEIWVNDEYLRVASTGLQESIQITNKTTQESYTLYPTFEQYVISPDISDKILDFGDDYELLSELPITFVKNKEKNIAGYNCKLAHIIVEAEGQSTHIDIWYAEDIPKVYWGEYAYLEKIPGAALEITTLGIGIQAYKVATEQIDSTLFQIPDNYTLSDFTIGHASYTDQQLGDDRFLYTDDSLFLSGVKDAEDNIITPPVYTSIAPYHDGQAVVSNEVYQYGTIDTNGEQIIPFSYDYLQYDESSKMFMFRLDEHYGLIGLDEKVIIPNKYQHLSFFNNGYAIFEMDNKRGLIDKEGREVVPASFDFITENSDTHFIAVNDQMEYALYAISTGKKTSEDMTMISLTEEPNLFLALKDDRYGYINHSGEVLIPFQYTSASIFADGVANVQLADTDEYFWINTKGEQVERNEEE